MKTIFLGNEKVGMLAHTQGILCVYIYINYIDRIKFNLMY